MNPNQLQLLTYAGQTFQFQGLQLMGRLDTFTPLPFGWVPSSPLNVRTCMRVSFEVTV
jgi:hypothetical protein